MRSLHEVHKRRSYSATCPVGPGLLSTCTIHRFKGSGEIV